jgi:hypothetical protein
MITVEGINQAIREFNALPLEERKKAMGIDTSIPEEPDTELEAALLSLIKGEFSSLTIDFNDHAKEYANAKEAIEGGTYQGGVWVSEDEKQEAIKWNRVWSLQWYPNTPNGHYNVLASSLGAAVAYALAIS